MRTRLFRSPTDKVIGGVAGGLAVWMNVDPSLVRIGWVLLAIFSGGIFVLVYFVMLLVVPLAPAGWTPPPPDVPGGRPPGRGTGTGWNPAAGTPPGPWSAPGPGAIPGWDSGDAPPAASSWGTWQTPAAPGGGTRPSFDPGNAGLVAGGALVLLGAWFLVDEYLDIDWSLLWPLGVIVLGVALIAGAMRRGRSSG